MYVDGFVLPIPKKNIAAYKKIATLASKVWLYHGALEYRECVGDDLDIKGVLPFAKTVRAKPTETVVFAWITYKSRAHRDQVNAKVMKDPRMKAPASAPFDLKRMAYGGFKTLVEG
jgi:uncharacterized protein YbaA (DUF1428 family)